MSRLIAIKYLTNEIVRLKQKKENLDREIEKMAGEAENLTRHVSTLEETVNHINAQVEEPEYPVHSQSLRDFVAAKAASSSRDN